jgi:hypothetical protein
MSPEYLDKTHFRNPPKVEIGLDGQLRYRGEAFIRRVDRPAAFRSPSWIPMSRVNAPNRSTRIPAGQANVLARLPIPQASSSSPTEQKDPSIPSTRQPSTYPDSHTPVVPSQPSYPPCGVPGFYPVQVSGYPPPHGHMVPPSSFTPPSSPPAAQPSPTTPNQHHYSYPNHPQPHPQSPSSGHSRSSLPIPHILNPTSNITTPPVTWPQSAAYEQRDCLIRVGWEFPCSRLSKYFVQR